MKNSLSHILEKLCSQVFKGNAMAYFVTDSQGLIRQWGGNLGDLKLPLPETTNTISDLLVFMEGILPMETESMDFSCITLPSGICIDAHVFKMENAHGLIIFDSSKKEAYLARAQQKANDLSLAIQEQKKRLTQLSDPVNTHSGFFTDFFLALNFAVLEMDDQGCFVLFGTPPGWIDLVPQSELLQSGQALEEDVFSFLGTFIQETKERWSQQKFDSFKSGHWIETDLNGQEYLFEATAVVIHNKRLLIISNDICAPEEKQSIIQKGRDLALHYNEMKRSGRRLRDTNEELEVRVRERTRELEQANEKLSLELMERKKAEHARAEALEQLRQSQKMEAIGTLAGGVAHDFNNILSAIIGFTELSIVEGAGGAKVQSRFGKILKASNRAKKLVSQILTFSHQRNQEREPVRLSRVVKEVLSLLEGSLPGSIQIKNELRSDAYILADHTQIHQVIMNLCTNAWQAMEAQGGILGVELTETDMGPANPEPGKLLLLTIQDTGEGIPQDAMDKIFDPYFTTKEKGTGLGLSVVHGIVSKSDGEISVETEPGKGSVFKLYFPVWRLRAD